MVNPGRVDLDFDLVKLAVALVARRVVGQHVVGAVVADDALERGGELVGVHRREAAGFIGERPQAVLRQPQLVVERADADARGRIVGKAGDADGVVAHRGQTARIDRVDADVGAGGGGDRFAGVVDDRRGRAARRVVAANDVGDVVVDAFADEQHRLAAAADAAEPVGDVLDRGEGRPRVLTAFEIVGIVAPGPAGPTSRWRKNSLLRVSVADSSFWPMNLSTAASSSRRLLVNSWLASVRPPVVTTAIRSLAPRLRWMN